MEGQKLVRLRIRLRIDKTVPFGFPVLSWPDPRNNPGQNLVLTRQHTSDHPGFQINIATATTPILRSIRSDGPR